MSCSNGQCQLHNEEAYSGGRCHCSCHGVQQTGCSCCGQGRKDMQKSCSCCQTSCHQSSCYEEEEDEYKSLCEHLVELADIAWMELVKEKLKEEIRNADADHIDQLVKVISSYNRQRWHAKLSEKSGCEDLEQQVKEIFASKHRKQTQ